MQSLTSLSRWSLSMKGSFCNARRQKPSSASFYFLIRKTSKIGSRIETEDLPISNHSKFWILFCFVIKIRDWLWTVVHARRRKGSSLNSPERSWGNFSEMACSAPDPCSVSDPWGLFLLDWLFSWKLFVGLIGYALSTSATKGFFCSFFVWLPLPRGFFPERNSVSFGSSELGSVDRVLGKHVRFSLERWDRIIAFDDLVVEIG